MFKTFSIKSPSSEAKLLTQRRVLGALAAPVLLSVPLYLISANSISLLQFGLATALLAMSAFAYLQWREKPTQTLPLFAILFFMYWVYFGVAVFLGERTISGEAGFMAPEVSEESVTAALLLAVVGTACLWAGMLTRVGRRLVPRRSLAINLTGSRLHYIRGVLILGTILGSIESAPFALGEGARQMLTIGIFLVPMVAFTLLFNKWLRREASHFDKVIVGGFLIFRFVTGLSSGWLGAFASTVVICGAVYVADRRKIPWLAVLLVVLFTLFFQVGKKDFRSAYWTAEASATKIDRVTFWTQRSFEIWGDALTDPTGNALREGLNKSLSRLSLLTQSANVLVQTPSVVPYQHGQLYSYIAITWIPRFIWPDKPSMNDANKFYQLAYGISAEDNIQDTNIGIGVLTEGYISFGWIGAAGIMFLLGIFCDFYQHAFLQKSAGMLMNGIGIVLLPQLMGLESQLAAYLGGFVQQVSFSLLLLLPIIQWTHRNPGLSRSNLVAASRPA